MDPIDVDDGKMFKRYVSLAPMPGLKPAKGGAVRGIEYAG